MKDAAEIADRHRAGWTTVRLAEVCQFKPPKSIARRTLTADDEVSFVPMSDLGELSKYFEPKEVKPLRDVLNAYTYFADGDVLCAKITPCFENGKLGIARSLTNGVGFGSSEFVVMRSGPKLHPEFLYYYLSRDEFREAGARVMSGAVGHRRVPKEYFEDLPIPLPPLKEQKRIVAVLDQAFAALDRARTHAEANLSDADEFLASYIEAELRLSGGRVLTLQNLLDVGAIVGHLDGNHGNDYPRKEEFVSEGVPYVSANCIVNQEIDLGRAKFLSHERAAQFRKGVARDRDVIFAHNATVGPVALLQTDHERVILSTSVTYYRCNPDQIAPEFLVYEMRGANFRRQYELVMRQATRNQVPITAQRKLTHTVPSINEQRRLVTKCAGIESYSRQLGEQYSGELRDLYSIRQSLLLRAFAGQLT